MRPRYWLYLAMLIVLSGSLSWLLYNHQQVTSSVQKELQRLRTSQTTLFVRYLQGQTDPYKLVALAQLIKGDDPGLVQLALNRAFELAPTNRDIIRLNSYFRPELKNQLLNQ